MLTFLDLSNSSAYSILSSLSSLVDARYEVGSPSHIIVDSILK